MSQQISPIMLLLGLLLLAGSFLWPAAGPSQGDWTEAKATRRQELNRKIHAMSHVGASHDGEDEHGADANAVAELATAKAERKQLQDELVAARQHSKQIAWYLKWGGISLVAVGAISYLAGRGQTG